MKFLFSGIFLCLFIACVNNQNTSKENPLVGTWKLVSGTVIQGGDTTITDFTKEQEMIKIINDTHFAFLRHDLNQGKDSTATYFAGGGTYTVKENVYTENLMYFNVREWEGHSFDLTFKIEADTLYTQAVEEVEALGVSQINIEKFIRLKK
ncbi:hypothetical protein [Joostella sp. CR20]|uniref:hypothetical protein n=1 Tax=Joostella sp. CR20 TaxID=2804312 RepID=UPI00313AA47E